MKTLSKPFGKIETPVFVMTVIFTAVFGLIYWSTCQITNLHSFRMSWYLDFETRAPFWPGGAFIYMSVTPLLLLLILSFRTSREMLPIFLVLIFEAFAGGAGFIFFPLKEGFPILADPDNVGFWYRISDAVNLDHNNFPSLHNTYAATAAWAIAKKVPFPAAAGLFLWAFAIFASTWLTHQHHLVDIAGGIALSVFSMGIIYPIAARDNVYIFFRNIWRTIIFRAFCGKKQTM